MPTADQVTLDEKASFCAGCGARIIERFYLMAVDREWHVECLKCSECSLRLDNELACFTRDGAILCREDYYKWVIINRISLQIFAIQVTLIFYVSRYRANLIDFFYVRVIASHALNFILILWKWFCRYWSLVCFRTFCFIFLLLWRGLTYFIYIYMWLLSRAYADI